jgi:hypothetical protein
MLGFGPKHFSALSVHLSVQLWPVLPERGRISANGSSRGGVHLLLRLFCHELIRRDRPKKLVEFHCRAMTAELPCTS